MPYLKHCGNCNPRFTCKTIITPEVTNVLIPQHTNAYT